MKSATSSRPSTSAFSYPVILAAVWFHSVTCIDLSTPKIGAFAVSMSWVSSSLTCVSSASAALATVTAEFSSRSYSTCDVRSRMAPAKTGGSFRGT